MSYATWLLDALRNEGVNVIPLSGWETRGRGPMGEIKGIMNHHTAGPKDATGTPSLRLIANGRPGFVGGGRTYPPLPGPLSQLYLATNGDCHLVAAGRCNHAGEGVWEGVVTGNLSFIGMEMENAGDGTDDWPREQYEAAIKVNAGVLRHLYPATPPSSAVRWACGHKEYARPRGRKIDPALPMDQFRLDVQRQLSGSPIVPTLTVGQTKVMAAPVQHSMLRLGDRGASVSQLQALLGIKADGIFGPDTKLAVEQFQRTHGLVVDGKVGPKTWGELL